MSDRTDQLLDTHFDRSSRALLPFDPPDLAGSVRLSKGIPGWPAFPTSHHSPSLTITPSPPLTMADTNTICATQLWAARVRTALHRWGSTLEAVGRVLRCDCFDRPAHRIDNQRSGPRLALLSVVINLIYILHRGGSSVRFDGPGCGHRRVPV